MKVNPVGWFEIYVIDMPRAKKFYETVFQTELEKLPTELQIEMHAFPMDMNTTGAGGALVKMEGIGGSGNSVIVYFTSEDCSKEESRVKSAGGEVHKTKFSIGNYGHISLAKDTEGNMFGIHSMK